jgi:cation diffusion facilitator CzcD-associated flavoprotein CzcO
VRDQGDLPAHARVLVVGAGFGGLAAAAYLRRAGFTAADDVLVIERGDDVGGTWRDNTYPGCACDVPSVLYSFSFAPEPGWTRSYGRQPDIQAYLRRAADEHGLTPLVRTGCELLEARWDAAAARWVARTSRGTVRAQVLVLATGTLSTPAVPDLPGLGEFAGEVFHTGAWRHDVQLAGRRVAVVGTGASAVQVVPAIAPDVAHLTVFQRTASWVLPRLDRPYLRPERALYRRVPAAQRAARGLLWAYREGYVVPMAHQRRLLPAVQAFAGWHLRRQVREPGLRAKVTPHFDVACKRPLLSNDWYPTLQRPDVELVDRAVVRATPTGLVDADGREHPVDVAVFATGFTPTEPPVARLVHGPDGASLAERWGGSPRAHRGISVPGFPNLFLMYGPNTNLAHSSIVYMLESQARYVADAVRTLERLRLAAVDVRADVLVQEDADLQHRLAGTVWNSGGCTSWYFDRTGRNSAMWPTFTWRYRNLVRRFDPESYRLQGEIAGGRAALPVQRDAEAVSDVLSE